jgi:hypothetical protein
MVRVSSVRCLHFRASLLFAGLSIVGCFDPEITHGQASASSTGEDTDPGTGTAPSTLESTSPTDPTTVDTTDGSESESTGVPTQCEQDDDCARMAGECEQASCEAGSCMVTPLDADTPCGDETAAACNGADSCDGQGECLDNLAVDGTSCTECALGLCACSSGACGECLFAPTNNFITTRATAGWELTGGWALYREAPQSEVGPAVRFDSQVLGTDGNRSQPYPGGEAEDSHARSAPTMLPATLELLSWHLDEGSGSGFDNKSIALSVDDGVTWQVVADCSLDPTLPFCVAVNVRAADAWDALTIQVPIEMQGVLGRVELRYLTGDECCAFEQGWYIDATNFATECACASDDTCVARGSSCGAASCGGDGECELDAVAVGTACGDAGQVECDASDACDGAGYCAAHTVATGLAVCTDCPAGAGACETCQQGSCNDCATLAATNDFANTGIATIGWEVESLDGSAPDWRFYFEAPPNTDVGSVAIPLSTGPSFGTDGNRVAPYDAAVDPFNAESEHSRVTTSPDIVPSTITFASWHVDEGTTDIKQIELSVDDGATWNMLADCTFPGDPFPFCVPFAGERAGDAWDPIALDTSAFAGQTGRLRFTYDTQDACCSFERGWFIDDLSFAEYCLDPQFP